MLRDGHSFEINQVSVWKRTELGKQVRGEEEILKTWGCVRRILQLINARRAQTRVEMEKNLQVKEIPEKYGRSSLGD